jgi:hypothetical protein
MCSLAELIQKLKPPHNKKRATKPERNDAKGRWGISAETIKATTAILHHGKYKHAPKLRSRIRMVVMVNFIVLVNWLIG